MTVTMHSTATLKDLARRAFQARNFADALQLYLEAFKHAATPQALEQQQQQPETGPSEWAILASNIAAVLLKLHRPEEALEYSKAAVQAAPGWSKALYRQAAALTALQQHSKAAQVLLQLQQLMPAQSAEAAAVALKLQAAQAAASTTAHHLQVQAQLMATHTAWAHTRARESAGRAMLLEQLQQGMSGYAWEPSDWEWRPTWTPSMRHSAISNDNGSNDSNSEDGMSVTRPPTQPAVPVDSKAVSSDTSAEALQSSTRAASRPERAHATTCYHATSLLDKLATAAAEDAPQQQQYMQLLAGMSKQLAELQGPQRGLALLNDNPLLLWYKRGLAEAIQELQPAAATVLVIANGGGGVLGMLAAAAGAATVYVIEGSRWGYRAAKQLLEGNREQQPELVSKVELVPVPLSWCRYKNCESTSGDLNNTASAVKAVETMSGSAVDETDTCNIEAGAGSIDAVVHVGTAAEKNLQQQQQQQQQQQPHQPPQDVSQLSGINEDAYFYLCLQANVVVTDLLDYSVLGQGLLPSLATAAASGLIAVDVTLLPHSVVIHGQLVNTRLTERVSGFDLGPINRYKWHPTMEHIRHAQLSHLQATSTPFQLHILNLTAHIAQNRPSNTTPSPSFSSPASTNLTADCDALLVWFELRTKAGAAIGTGPSGTTAADDSCTAANSKSCMDSGNDDGVDSCTSGCDASICTCFGLGLYYLDNPIAAASEGVSAAENKKQKKQLGQELIVTTALQHDLRLRFSVMNHSGGTSSNGGYSWSPHGFPHDAMLPRWHFDMVSDEMRNSAYDAAIRRAISAVVTADACPDGVHLLDVGTGTGLLAMMAARSGASRVAAVESVRHLAETASAVAALNGYSSSIQVVHKDGRFLTVRQPGRTEQHDMMRPADLLAFEVFDCGLIGEGALHIVASARAHLLQPGAKILPASAKVYCQPIQYNRQTAAALANILDPSQMNAYAWQPDYFEADLRIPAGQNRTPTSDNAVSSADSTDTLASAGAMCPAAVTSVCAGKPCWLPLAAPQLTFEFDFNCTDPMSAFQPAVQQLLFAVDASGICNAVAFWFELQLDEQTCLSSSPYCCSQRGPSTTWKQAVQLLPEHQVHPGQQLSIAASHDTYAISFAIAPSTTSCLYRTPGSSCSGNLKSNSSRPETAPEVELTLQTCRAIDTAADAVVGNSRSGSVCSPTLAAGAAGSSKAAAEVVRAPQPTGLPLVDPEWKAAYDIVSQLQSNLVKALTQDPLEYRKLVNAALVIAMRPWGEESISIKEGVMGRPSLAGAISGNSELDGNNAAGLACEKRIAAGALQLAGDNVLRAKRFEADPHHAAALLVRLMS